MTLMVTVIEIYAGVKRTFTGATVQELKSALVAAHPWSTRHGGKLEDILSRLECTQALCIRTDVTRLRLVHDVPRARRYRSSFSEEY